MDYFHRQHSELYAEDVSVTELAQQYGTPLYVYSKATLERHWHAFNDGFGDYPHLVCYAVKANSNLAVLQVMAKLGSGFDIVSGGELERVLAAGGAANKIVFSGVGKLTWEIERALEVGILSFNVESFNELQRIAKIATEKQKIAAISVRVNPNVDAQTHPYISTGLKENKFGVSPEAAIELYQFAQQHPHLKVTGVDCHIGSQLIQMQPFLDALDKVLELLTKLEDQGINISHLNLGGGIGVPYHDETPPHPTEYSQAIKARLPNKLLTIIVEPGRAIAANAGILVTRVEYLKQHHDKHFAIVDAAMNDLLRPSIYNAYHEIVPASLREGKATVYDIVGPVCETGDFLGKDRSLCLQENDLLAVRGAGAYCFTMSSNYNSRPRPAEIMVDGKQTHVVRARETLNELYAHEQLLSKE